MNSLHCENVYEKLNLIETSVQEAFTGKWKSKGSLKEIIPELPGREIQVLNPLGHPDKLGLSHVEGQARLLHDLASIELQALELALRSLYEYADAPEDFRQQLAELCLSEARHLKLCLQGLEKLNFKWGHWPVHLSLWAAVSREDSLLDRIFIVHRYLEGSGLDAGNQLLRRLNGVQAGDTAKILEVINTEEIDHVDFGSRWYRKICQEQGTDPSLDLQLRIEKLRYRLPRRMEKVNRELRKKAGFNETELQIFENLRESFLKGASFQS